MTRTAIFVIYQKDNHLPQDVIYLLKELKTIADKIVIVVNGSISEENFLKEESDYLIIRENLGFDAGAYKTALNDKNVQEIINQSDELVFCNDTFYGPLIPFRDIFKKMDTSACDFWGLSLMDKGIEVFLQSNFLVFRKRIIENDVLEEYCKKYINEKTTDFNVVLRYFERKLFTYLVEKKYLYSYYCKITTFDIGESVIFNRVPILRKKAFIPQAFNTNSILSTLSFIENNYYYPVKMILEDINSRFGIKIFEKDFKNINITNNIKNRIPYVFNVKEKVKIFVQENKLVYLYGTGRYAQNIVEIVGLKNIAGFIVSDEKNVSRYFYNKSVKKIGEINGNYSLPIIVAMGLTNSKQVKNNLKDFTRVLYLWDLN